MRVFLIWAAKYEEIEPLINGLKENGHKIVYWVWGGKGPQPRMPGCVLHHHREAWAGLPAKGIDINDFPPPGKDLIERFYKTESLILTMMNKKFDQVCVDKRRHIYYNMLRYWQGVIKKYKPEAIIFATVPHTVYNYIIYQLAKNFGVKTIMFEDSWVSDRLLCYTDWQQGNLVLQRELRKNQGKNFSLEGLSSDLQEYYKLQTSVQVDSTPVYMKYWKAQFSGLDLFKNKLRILSNTIKEGTVLKRVSAYALKQFKQNLKKEYVSVQAKPDLSQPFVYAPLSFQPERTTSPQGDMFVDQILMVEILAASLSKGWLVYVKEHPAQWWLRCGINYSSSRYPGYYKRLAEIKNVRLVPINTNTFTLINRSRVVATVTGTAGWEALLRGKPAIVFGYPWYRDCPSVLRVNDVKTCRTALKKIANGFQVNQQYIINYLKSFDKATIHGYIERFVEKNSKLTKQQSMQNISQAILKELFRPQKV